MTNTKIKVGVSIGDVNGIGMEIILKTFKDNRMMEFCTPIIFGSTKIFSYYRKLLHFENFSFNIINSIKDANPKNTNLINLSKDDVEITLGKASSNSGEFSFKSINTACKALENKEIDVLVTAPINKSSIQEKIQDFVGHTEFLQKKFEGDALMIMVSDTMKISCVSSHIPLADVKTTITPENIIKKIKLLNASLIKDFGIRKPKIAIIGLNPHAGENGLLGVEEKEIIIPTIKKIKEDGIIAFGPYPADSFFTQKNLIAFDGILAMYHDQGLIPFKALSFNEGVNYTAGLNIIRTSPVHGTAYEIAGKGDGNEKSFREAVFLACNIFKKRAEFNQLNDNALVINKIN